MQRIYDHKVTFVIHLYLYSHKFFALSSKFIEISKNVLARTQEFEPYAHDAL